MKKSSLPRSKPPSRWQSYLFLLINAACWGAALIVVKPALDVTTPFRYQFLRYVVACVASIPLLIHYWPLLKKYRKLLSTILFVELIGTTLSTALLYSGLEYNTAIEASLITTTTPIFTTLAGIIFLKEREERHEAIGLGIAFIGTVLLTILPLLNQGSQVALGTSFFGNLLIVGQNLALAAYFVLAKKKYKNLPVMFITTLSFYVGLVSFFGLSLVESKLSLISLASSLLSDINHWSVLLAAGYMGIFGSIIGLSAYLKGQEGVEASEASLFVYLEPLVYIPLGIIFLKETVMTEQYIALLIIVIGVVLAQLRLRRTKRRPA